MRTLRLARIAAEAEGLRLRQQVRRTAIRAACGMVAMAFVIAAVVFAHIAAWYWLRITLERQHTALIMAGADLVLALILVLLAARSSPGRVEIEALAVRQQAMESAASSLALSSLALQSLRLVTNMLRRSRR